MKSSFHVIFIPIVLTALVKRHHIDLCISDIDAPAGFSGLRAFSFCSASAWRLLKAFIRLAAWASLLVTDMRSSRS